MRAWTMSPVFLGAQMRDNSGAQTPEVQGTRLVGSFCAGKDLSLCLQFSPQAWPTRGQGQKKEYPIDTNVRQYGLKRGPGELIANPS